MLITPVLILVVVVALLVGVLVGWLVARPTVARLETRAGARPRRSFSAS